MTETDLDALAFALIQPQLEAWLRELQEEKGEAEQKDRAA